MNSWTIISKFKNGKMFYAVCRVIDINKEINENNLEFASGYSESLEEVENLAKHLNLQQIETIDLDEMV